MSGGAIAVFDFAVFSTRYPELAGIGSTLAQAYFDEATVQWRNDGTGPVTKTATQLRILNAATAHIAFLNAPRDGNGNPASSGAPPPRRVGRQTSVSQGSVSMQMEYADEVPGSQAWWVQTQYGASFWAMTQQYRLGGLYVPGPRQGFARGFPGLGGRILPW